MKIADIDGAQGIRIEAVAGLEDAVREACARDSGWASGLFTGAAATPSAEADSGPVGRAPVQRLALGSTPDGGELLVRRGHRGGWLKPWLRDRHSSPQRVRRELRVALALHERGAPVPAPAFCAYRRQGAGWQTAFASARLLGTRDLRGVLESLHQNRMTTTDAAQIARAVGRAVRDFHDAGGSHADLNLGNVVVAASHSRHSNEGETAEYRAWLVDLDRSSCASPPAARRRMRELLRLRRSLRKLYGDHPRAVAVCFSAYCRGDRGLRRALLDAAGPEWKRLRRHERWRIG